MNTFYPFTKIISTLLFTTALLTINSVAQAQVITKEAEDGTLTDVTKATSIAGYSGSGYVYMADKGSLKITITAPTKAYYNLVIAVNTSMGGKSQDLYVNNSKFSTLIFPANNSFFNFNAGNILLQAGDNTIEIVKNWGWMYFDKFTFTVVPPHDYSTTVSSLINPNADQKTKDVYSFLRSNYGSKIISGQTDYWSQLIAISGKSPVLRAFDMQNYSPHNPWHNDWSSWDDGTVQNAIDWYNSTNDKGIVSFQWHWFSPSGGQLQTSIFMADKTTFDVSKVSNTASQEYTDIVRDIDAIAVQLKRLQTAGVPVLWRPLHEAGGAWFWWGAKGSASCLALYDLMYDRLTNHHGLNNLIWVWSTPEADWYPGNSKVDILGYDSYPGAYSYGSQKSVFDQLFSIVDGKKLIALTENGPIPDIDKCIEEDAMWCYFSSWVDLVNTQNTTQHIVDVYAHSAVTSLDEVADFSTEVQFNSNATKQLLVYPNPSTNEVYVSFTSTNNNLETLQVFNELGELMYAKNNISGNVSEHINISDFPNGIYFIQSNSTNTKFLVVR